MNLENTGSTVATTTEPIPDLLFDIKMILLEILFVAMIGVLYPIIRNIVKGTR